MENPVLEIGENKYEIMLPPARTGMALSIKVGVMAGPVLASLGLDVDKEGLVNLLNKVLTGIDPDKLDGLFITATTISRLHCNGEPIFAKTDFERHFNENKGEVFQVSAWALVQSVKDFLPGAANFGQLADKFKEKFVKEFASRMDGKLNTGSEDPNGKDSATTKT